MSSLILDRLARDFGHSGKPNDTWLLKQEKEPILKPELPIIGTHHHLWYCGD
jgi:hypothetical protein